jgi:hypothetical protein
MENEKERTEVRGPKETNNDPENRNAESMGKSEWASKTTRRLGDSTLHPLFSITSLIHVYTHTTPLPPATAHCNVMNAVGFLFFSFFFSI